MPDTAKTRDQYVRERIIHVLKIYPIISPTMLQAGLGPKIKAKEWREQLELLKTEGIVLQDEPTDVAPSGRYNTYRRIYLSDLYMKRSA